MGRKWIPRQKARAVIEGIYSLSPGFASFGSVDVCIEKMENRKKMTDQKKNSLDGDKTVKDKDIKKLVKDVIAQQLGVDESKIVESASFANDLGADSLDVVELVMALEEKFDITIPDEHSEKIQTFGAAVEYIREHLESREALEGNTPAA